MFNAVVPANNHFYGVVVGFLTHLSVVRHGVGFDVLVIAHSCVVSLAPVLFGRMYRLHAEAQALRHPGVSQHHNLRKKDLEPH